MKGYNVNLVSSRRHHVPSRASVSGAWFSTVTIGMTRTSADIDGVGPFSSSPSCTWVELKMLTTGRCHRHKPDFFVVASGAPLVPCRWET